MGACFVCNEERNQALPFFMLEGSESNTDLSPKNFVSSIGDGREQKMKSVSEQDISKADGTILNEKSVITSISATYSENQQSLTSKDDQTSSKRTTTSAQVVIQKASYNSIIEKNEFAPGVSASEECTDVTSNSVREEEKNTFVIPEDRSLSPDTPTSYSGPRKVHSTLTSTGLMSDGSPVSVITCGPIRKWRTLSPNELNSNRDEAQGSRQDNLKIYPIQKPCFEVKEKV